MFRHYKCGAQDKGTNWISRMEKCPLNLENFIV
jgi:hypothetical protein